ncbi:unnamed protein product [Mytilus edulis]|uniref:Uncharacterized protein n=1 Tax=Mytilus edulis TaxID=6550 RepID=A0A8S3T1K1_MYTED|nr:unnamed protein product [Mytilus edulis]
MKPDGQYHRVLEMTCCPDYMERVLQAILTEPACHVSTVNDGQQCKLTCNCTRDLCDSKTGCKNVKQVIQEHFRDKECPDGYYGMDCQSICKCSEHSDCDHETGHYVDVILVMKADFVMTHAVQDPMGLAVYTPVNVPERQYATLRLVSAHVIEDGSECSSGYYGAGCLQRCGCLENQHCHHVTGDCQCEAGKKGLHCNENKSTVGISVGIVVGILVLVGCLLLIVVLKRRKRMSAIQDLQKMKRDDFSSNHYEDIDTYAEIPDSKLLPNYPYSYADSTDVKPPIKERQPTTKRTRNIYLSVTDAQRFSKLSVSSGDIKSNGDSSDYLNPYTGLIRDVKCASYQEINKVTKERNLSNESDSGYVKPASGAAKSNDINNRQCNDYIDAKSSIRHNNDNDLDMITKKSRNESESSIQSGYLKMNSSLKKKSETDADYSTMDMDENGSLNSVFLPKITISSQNGSTETLNIRTNE